MRTSGIAEVVSCATPFTSGTDPHTMPLTVKVTSFAVRRRPGNRRDVDRERDRLSLRRGILRRGQVRIHLRREQFETFVGRHRDHAVVIHLHRIGLKRFGQSRKDSKILHAARCVHKNACSMPLPELVSDVPTTHPFLLTESGLLAAPPRVPRSCHAGRLASRRRHAYSRQRSALVRQSCPSH